MTPWYARAADGVLILHVSFVGVVVFGLVLILIGWRRGWRWTRRPSWRWGHLAAIVYVVMQTWWGAQCPLTTLENHLRRAAGQDIYGTGFIATWVGRALFYQAPDWVFALVYTLFGAAVLLTFLLYPPRHR